MQFQLSAKGKRGQAFWLEWTVGFAAARRGVVDALRARDVALAQAAMASYLVDQHAAVASDRELAGIRLSDPKALATVADVMLKLRAGPPPRR
jgi:hypothetical protein